MNADEEKRIIASTYFDKMNVYRPFKSTLNTGESAFKNGLEGKKIYEDVPCALSSLSGGSRNANVPAPKVESDYNYFMILKSMLKRMIQSSAGMREDIMF